MQGQGDLQTIIQTLEERLTKKADSFKKVAGDWEKIETMELYFGVYEQYYFRTNSNAGLSVMFLKKDDKINGHLVTAAGGVGILGFTHKTERDFLNLVKTELEKLDFEVIPEESLTIDRGV